MHFDNILIGAGQAAPSLAVRLAQAGRRVAIIERDILGGTCVNTGCTPTKAMVASAYAMRMLARAGEYGVTLEGGFRADLRQIKARKDAIVQKSVRGLDGWLRSTANLTVIEGHARFVDPHAVEVNGERHTGERFFLNTGGRAAIPAIPGLAESGYLTNASILELEELPEHLIILGGSYIGLEFGQMFRRFGSRVTIIERKPRLVEREDPDVSEAIAGILQAEGIELRLNTECARVDAGPRVTLTDGGVVEGSHLLAALGRAPNTDDLGLDAAGVARTGSGYIQVDDQLRTSQPHIWALGDCNGRGAFTHTSYNDYEIVAANLLEGARPPRLATDRIACYALYIDPPLGRAGLAESQVRALGRPALIGRRPMTRVARAVEKGETQGFMKILVDAESGQILGAAILGVGGDEAIHAILDLMSARVPYPTLRRTVHIHPTLSELIPTMLGELRPLV